MHEFLKQYRYSVDDVAWAKEKKPDIVKKITEELRTLKLR